MPKLVVKLMQHTPILHFQDEEGAGIRGTELKPLLDRFLLQHALKQVVKWKIKSKDSNEPIAALEYRVVIDDTTRRIPAISPADWNSIGVFPLNRIKKTLKLGTGAVVTFHSAHAELLECMREWIGPFFACSNYGHQKTKGFGSYTVKEIDGQPYSGNIEEDVKKALGDSWILYESPSVSGQWVNALLAGATMRKKMKPAISIDNRRKESPFLLKPVSQGNNWRIFYLPRMINLGNSAIYLSTKIPFGSNVSNRIPIKTQAAYEGSLKQILEDMCKNEWLKEVKNDD